ncbi:uncharacterized protein PRCAT00002521001 [Priceomyces carsonii]|uniref:uncharacterized protein n=1 Tax=Priceomyces carsonii TaxID=28549 RepID=UPI002ED8E9BE|nr:unnamed protein product [Priceomyces carsonii]
MLRHLLKVKDINRRYFPLVSPDEILSTSLLDVRLKDMVLLNRTLITAVFLATVAKGASLPVQDLTVRNGKQDGVASAQKIISGIIGEVGGIFKEINANLDCIKDEIFGSDATQNELLSRVILSNGFYNLKLQGSDSSVNKVLTQIVDQKSDIFSLVVGDYGFTLNGNVDLNEACDSLSTIVNSAIKVVINEIGDISSNKNPHDCFKDKVTLHLQSKGCKISKVKGSTCINDCVILDIDWICKFLNHLIVSVEGLTKCVKCPNSLSPILKILTEKQSLICPSTSTSTTSCTTHSLTSTSPSSATPCTECENHKPSTTSCTETTPESSTTPCTECENHKSSTPCTETTSESSVVPPSSAPESSTPCTETTSESSVVPPSSAPESSTPCTETTSESSVVPPSSIPESSTPCTETTSESSVIPPSSIPESSTPCTETTSESSVIPPSSIPESSTPCTETTSESSVVPPSSIPESSTPCTETTSESSVVPPSSIPESSAPASSALASSVAESSVPASSAPASSVLASSAPASSVPASSVPASSVAESSAPASSVAESSAPSAPGSNAAPSSSAAPSSIAPASSFETVLSTTPSTASTPFSISTTIVTVTSCSKDQCSTVTVPTGLTTVTKESTIYTTYCPLTSESETTDKVSKTETETETETEIQTTIVTVTSCESNECSITTIPTGLTTIVKDETTHTTYCPLPEDTVAGSSKVVPSKETGTVQKSNAQTTVTQSTASQLSSIKAESAIEAATSAIIQDSSIEAENVVKTSTLSSASPSATNPLSSVEAQSTTETETTNSQGIASAVASGSASNSTIPSISTVSEGRGNHITASVGSLLAVAGMFLL